MPTVASVTVYAKLTIEVALQRRISDRRHCLRRSALTIHGRLSRVCVGLNAFDSCLQGSPEVQGSKFVIGAIIPGTSNKATKEDVFVVVRATASLSATLEGAFGCSAM